MPQSQVDDDRVSAVRSFNRFYTNAIGLLGKGILETSYTLTEVRVLFELAQRQSTEVVALRRTLDIDAGYLSRMLARFERAGLVRRTRSETDGRRQIARLTPRGRSEFRKLDARSAAEVRDLIADLTDDDQHRLVKAMRSIQRTLTGEPPSGEIRLREPRSGDLGWVVQRHGAVYAAEYGWDETFEALVARIVADYADTHDPARERAWIAEVDGGPAGFIMCVKKTDTMAKLRLLLVEPEFRGMGIGGRLVGECVEFARQAGYSELRLWTNNVLVDARRIYERAGFQLVDEEPHHSFGHDLVGQTWTKQL